MSEKTYTITRTEVLLAGGVKVNADVTSINDIKSLLTDLKGAGLGDLVQAEDTSGAVSTGRKSESDDPAKRIETQAGIEEGRLSGAKILAIKDDIPQLLQKTIFTSVTDAVLVLMYALEVGLKRKSVNYDDFVPLFEAQQLKAGSPLSMLVNNIRNAGYFDGRAYADGRKLRLTAKGETKAVEVLKKLATRSG